MSITNLKSSQLNSLVLMRILIGWHFLYEGIIKLYNPSWTAKGYLMSSEGVFKPLFVSLANDSIIGLVDGINIGILIVVGICLILGMWVRWTSYVGAVLLLFYYLSHPAFPGMNQGPTEGSYWIVNKNLIEAAALIVLAQIPTAYYFSIKLLFKKRETPTAVQS